MVVGEANINNIMGGIANTGVRLHTYKRKLKQRFDIIKKLGQGTYGKVQLGINKETGQEVAIKTIKKSKIETEADLIRIRREIQIMSSVRHPNIVHIYEVFENREKMVLVMEYAAGGELYDYLSERKVLAEEEARRIFRQIAIACYYCHKHKICHRDLKLENILLDENGNAKIADFGLSNVFDETRLLSTFCGSPLYASPEIVKGTPYHGPEVDCWSLGVLLYTLVYGAMPFDGSNFKRLVKQISQGDYFEPKKPSPASPLIREMLTVNPKHRADIEKICSHWWVNEGYDESALEISEYLANQTPVRLDYLLSLAPPPPQLESDKLVVTGDVAEEALKTENVAPTRSQSVGSLMELSHPAEKRIKDLLSDEIKTPKRKLEVTASMEQVNTNRKDKIIKENTVADISVHATIHENASLEDASMTEAVPLDKSRTQTLSKEMDVENVEEVEQGAACAEIIEEAKKNEVKKPLKTNKTNSSLVPTKLEEINEHPSQENLCMNDKENVNEAVDVKEVKTKEAKEEAKITPTKKAKKVLTDKDENRTNDKKEETKDKVEAKEEIKIEETKKDDAENKPLERRRSRIYEQAEKFQNLIAANESKTNVPEKPKKVILPGVSVDGYKKQFERKCSLTSTSPPKVAKCSIPKRISIDKQSAAEKEKSPEKAQAEEKKKEDTVKDDAAKIEKATEKVEGGASKESDVADERKMQLKNAVSVISSALEKEGTRKSKSRPCIRKPPVPFGMGGRSASGSIGMITSPMSPEETTKQLKVQISPNNDTRTATVQVSTPEHIKYDPNEANKTSSAEITLKSATLPRRKTTKAEIHLNYPQPKPATMEFKTEMAHRIEAPPKLTTQRSEAVFPVAAAPNLAQRSASVEPETKSKPKERIIPIAVEKQDEKKQNVNVASPTAAAAPAATVPKVLQNQKSYQSQRSSSLSRQSTQESDSETAASGTGEPIRKSPREYIIPIAVEGGGYVTPRAGSLEPSETGSTTSTITNSSRRSKFSRNAARRMNSLLSDREGSEDESSPFGVHRHSSFGRDSDTEESRKDTFPMHRLRSSRPRKANLEHADSMSSGEDDDDDGFDILTAENLFSTLLSRVKDLTQRINVDDRPGFPSSRLLSHFDHGMNFWNFKSRLDPFARTTPFGRTLSQERAAGSSQAPRPAFGAPWRRSVSRDLASDIESVFNENRTPTETATLPRGDRAAKHDNLNLSDLNLKQLKLSDEDAMALSYLTPGLSRRIQKQLLAQLPPSEAKKLTRTMSMRNPRERTPADEAAEPKSLSTLPRRYSAESRHGREYSLPRMSRPGNKPTTISEEFKTYDYGSSPKPCESPALGKYLHQELSPAEVEKPKVPTLPKKSRFLRPDFYDRPKEESTAVKEKKEREMETQKVLKEIRDKRKSRLNLRRERSLSRDTSKSESTDSKSLDEKSKTNGFDSNLNNNNGKEKERFGFIENGNNNRSTNEVTIKYKPYIENIYGTIPKCGNNNCSKIEKAKRKSSENNNGNCTKDQVFSSEENLKTDTNRLLNNVSDSIKTIEKTIETINNSSNHDYVNIPLADDEKVPKKDIKLSRLVRPKSYPTDTLRSVKPEIKKEIAVKTKIAKPKRGVETKELKLPETKELKSEIKDSKQENKSGTKEVKNKSPPKTNGEKSNKNRFLHSIEKKIEKLRGLNNSRENSVEKKLKDEKEKKSNIETAIKKLREQSLPRSTDRCITESGLIKRAVSVEDVPTCSGTPKELQPSRKSVTKILGLFKKYEEKDKTNKTSKLKKPKEVNSNERPEKKRTDNNNREETEVERPKSYYEPPLSKIEETKAKTSSRLPINSFRRSLNLENKPKSQKIEENGNSEGDLNDNFDRKPDRKTLTLDLSNASGLADPIPSTSSENRNSTATDDSSLFLSPCDDNMSCDSWSACSDYHAHDPASPVSLNGNIYSGDEGESVIDRIRRKSFYTRFNEKRKQPARRPTLCGGGYRDPYGDCGGQRKGSARSPGDYGSLDRRPVDYRFAPERRLSYGAYEPPPVKKEYRPYARSSSLLNDYVNVPHRYQTYNPRLTKHLSSLYSPDTEDDAVDDLLSAAKTRLNSYHYQPSRLTGRASSISPSIDKL